MKEQTQKCGPAICGNFNDGKCSLEEIEVNRWGMCANLWIGTSSEESEGYMDKIQEEFFVGIMTLSGIMK